MFDWARKAVLNAAILALAISAYQIVFKPMYDAWLTGQGHVIGFGETSLGYFIAIMVTFVVKAFLLRKMGNQK